MAPRVELLWWRGCPSWEETREILREEMEAAGLDPGRIEMVEIASDEDVAREGFVGSPTIRIDGRDVADPGEQPASLTCRIYRLRDGRISALPDRLDLREALGAASADR